MSQTDSNKRRELLAELMYYLFDSFLILLIRTNFHVTESNVDRNRLYYFRHDVWRKLSEPALTHLKTTMFEEMKTDKASRVLATRLLGYSQVRLLPKKLGARPITNLRRRMQITINGRAVLGRSINSVMKPVFNVLNYEKVCLSNSCLPSRILKTRIAGHAAQQARLVYVLCWRHVSSAQDFPVEPPTARFNGETTLLCQGRCSFLL